MKITMSKNPINRLLCSIDNHALEVKNKHWNSGRHKCRCHICGEVLDSKKDKWCPEECGWERLKDKKIYDPWICLSCLERHDSFWKRKDNQWTKRKDSDIQARNDIIDEVSRAIEDKFMSVAPDELYYSYQPYQIVREVREITDKLKDK